MSIFQNIYVIIILSSPVLAAEPISMATDCTDLEVQADIDPELSKDENLQRLSDIFYQSLNTVTHCEASNNSASGAQSSTEKTDAMDSVPASDISGTEPVESLSESSADQISEADTSEYDERDMAKSNTELSDAMAKAPDDIPPADNDSIFEKQIREAAENETDPEVRARLWNEYRKYKGLPVKPVEEDL